MKASVAFFLQKHIVALCDKQSKQASPCGKAGGRSSGTSSIKYMLEDLLILAAG